MPSRLLQTLDRGKMLLFVPNPANLPVAHFTSRIFWICTERNELGEGAAFGPPPPSEHTFCDPFAHSLAQLGPVSLWALCPAPWSPTAACLLKPPALTSEDIQESRSGGGSCVGLRGSQLLSGQASPRGSCCQREELSGNSEPPWHLSAPTPRLRGECRGSCGFSCPATCYQSQKADRED